MSAPRRSVEERVTDYRHVYTALPASMVQIQADRCMDCGVAFCTHGCPLGNLIPDWNELVARNQWRAAIERLHRTNNFPEFTGLLCPAPCEASCVLAINDDAVTIKQIELQIVERAWSEGWIVPAPPETRTGKRVAVVGSGPAGLAAAQGPNRAGHTVTVFEKDDRIGGLLRYGIPDFKLEKWMLDRRLQHLRHEGLEFVINAHVGSNPTLDDMRKEFDAILVAGGALEGRDLQVPGRDLQGIHKAMAYLTQQNRHIATLPVAEDTAISAASKHVLILGGGDTSADCLGNAHREGAASVNVLTHGEQPPNERDPLSWPDWPFVLRTYPAHEEGGARHWDTRVTGFSGSDGRVERVHLVHIGGSEEWVLPVDLVLLAIGFSGPVRDRLLADLQLEFTDTGAIASQRGYRTSQRGVFVAGDARTGASLIVRAIAEGRGASNAICAYLAA